MISTTPPMPPPAAAPPGIGSREAAPPADRPPPPLPLSRTRRVSRRAFGLKRMASPCSPIAGSPASAPRLTTLMITAQQLEVRAGARLLMADVTFRVAAGDKVGLVGRNGAGKTT